MKSPYLNAKHWHAINSRVWLPLLFGMSLVSTMTLTACSSDSETVPEESNEVESNEVESNEAESNEVETSEVELTEDRISFPGLSIFGLAGQPADQVFTQYTGAVFLDRFDALPGAGFIRFNGREYTPPTQVQHFIDFYLGQVELEECIVRPNGETDVRSAFQGSPGRDVSAGDTITINTPSGPLHTININDETRYRINDLSDPVPPDTTLSLPGEIFPSVAAYPIADTVSPTGLIPDPSAAVDVNTVYSWDASDDSSTYMEILFYEFTPDGAFVATPVRCDVLDDGSFELPDDALNWVASSDNVINIGYFRIQRRMDFNDGILFYQKATAVGGLLTLVR